MPSRAQRVDERPQLLAHLRVQADGRLVEQQQPRAVHERAGDEQPPAHAARQLVDLRVAAVGEVGDLQRALDRGLALAARQPVEVREDEQVLLDGQRRVEVVELRRDAHRRARLLGLAGQRVAEHLELAGVGDRPGRSASSSSSTCRRRWDRAGRRTCPRARRGRGRRRRRCRRSA